MTPPPLEAVSALCYCHKTWHQQPGESTGSPKTRMSKRAPDIFHNVSGMWDKKQHFWGQLRAILTELEANSGKQLSLRCRLRRSWGLAKFRMTGTPKEKRENTSKEFF